MEKFHNKFKTLKSKFRFSKVIQVLREPQMISYLKILQEEYVMCPMTKLQITLHLYVRNIISKYS